jgi:hypothetical protein
MKRLYLVTTITAMILSNNSFSQDATLVSHKEWVTGNKIKGSVTLTPSNHNKFSSLSTLLAQKSSFSSQVSASSIFINPPKIAETGKPVDVSLFNMVLIENHSQNVRYYKISYHLSSCENINGGAQCIFNGKFTADFYYAVEPNSALYIEPEVNASINYDAAGVAQLFGDVVVEDNETQTYFSSLSEAISIDIK